MVFYAVKDAGQAKTYAVLQIPQVAFSLGLALVLVLLGVGVVYANRAGGRRFAERRWFRSLPVVSSAILIGLGVWFARDGWHMIIDP